MASTDAGNETAGNQPTAAGGPAAAARRQRAPRRDALCMEAVDLARAAITEVGPDQVGGYEGAFAEADRVVTHLFSCLLDGYRGWCWAVTVARAPRSRKVTVSETVLLPGATALRPPDWVPWGERLKPGDLGVGDLLPPEAEDDRLMPGYVHSDDPAVEEVAGELGLGRPRVMSRQGRIDTAQRWYDGDHGPHAAISTGAPENARCGTCGFWLPLAGWMRQTFGVCGNFYAPDDGRVVSADHGCGAHSEVLTVQDKPPLAELPTVYDDNEVEPVLVGGAHDTADGGVEPSGHGEPPAGS